MHCTNCNYDLRNLPRSSAPSGVSTCPECGQSFDPAVPSTFLNKPEHPATPIIRRLAIASAILVLCTFIAVPFLVIRGIRNATLAEERLQATRAVLTLIADHVAQSPTHAWPTSWADLEKLPYPYGMYPWPQDAARYKAIVTVNFSLTTDAVLQQTPATCTAVTIGPGPEFAGFPRMEFAEFLDRLSAATTNPPSDGP